MATGLPTFDAFSWASLLAGRQALVIDRSRGRGLALAAALEEAGAVVTLAPGQAIGVDRLGERPFALVLLALSEEEPVQERLVRQLAASPVPQLAILGEPSRHTLLRATFAGARIGDHSMGARDLVLFLIGTPDE
jgi:CheY-like chemotaxis protein